MQLELYHRWDCPSSTEVRSFISDNNLGPHINFINVDECPSPEKEIPCLVVNGTAIESSDAIIFWLRSHLLYQSSASL